MQDTYMVILYHAHTKLNFLTRAPIWFSFNFIRNSIWCIYTC